MINIAEALLVKEILSSDEIDAIIKGKKLAKEGKEKKARPISKDKKEKSKEETKKLQPLKKPDLAKA